ncbi:MAG TPA: nickel pincer cofactor biosynthesis protein LarC [Blastocatellia bacterium]|nr:nickel pincer cofactor biosynthesis protein LarC [Blastocatellia bacterium]
MRAVYFDCFAGLSGDMIIGAQLDLGLDFESLNQQLLSLGLDGYKISSRRVTRSGIAATKFDVEVDEKSHPARTIADIRSIILRSNVSQNVKDRAISVFERLAQAEANIHATIPDKVHFHEVGAVDSIIDIVGAMIGFESLGVDRFFCSPLRVGSGTVETQHGTLPIPAPATAQLLSGIPVYAGEVEGEFVTPTGAAIAATLCEQFGPLPQMRIAGAGYGAGSRDPKGFPNTLRLVIGAIESVNTMGSAPVGYPSTFVSEEVITVIETNIDDMNPQIYSFVLDRAWALGALDVFLTAVQMKKDRPGVLLTVLCKPEAADATINMLLAETTTLGVRYYQTGRRILERTIETVETEYGQVRIKVARSGSRTLHFQPEYEDCARLAAEAKVTPLEVQSAAIAAYRSKLKI